MNLKNRPLYLKRLEKYKSYDEVKILVGIRGAGKTSLLNLFMQNLTDSGVSRENIIRLDLDTLSFEDVDGEIFYTFISGQIPKQGETFLLLDEVKKIQNWQTVISKLKKNFNLNIYLTCSTVMSEDEFVGFLQKSPILLKILPLSFKEFLCFHEFPEGMTLKEKFEFYLMYGGMPSISSLFFDDSAIKSALLGNFSGSLVCDVLPNSKINDFDLMTTLIQKIYEYSATIQSFSSLSKIISKKNPAIRTVENYIDKILYSHLVYSEIVTDIKGNHPLSRFTKYYPADIGYKNLLLGESELTEQTLESLVYLEFLRLNADVSILRIEGQTIFKIERGDLGDKIYISVIKNFQDKSNKKINFPPFNALKNMFAKWIITADEMNIISNEGIKVTNIIDFLMSE